MLKKAQFFGIVLSMLVSFGLKAETYQVGFESVNPDIPIDSVIVTNTNTSESVVLMDGDLLSLISTVGFNNNIIIHEGTLDIFPNPMNEKTLVSFAAKTNGKAVLGVYEVSGREVFKVQRNLNKGINSFELSGLGDGLYFVSAQGANYRYTSKVVSRSGNSASPNLVFLGNRAAEHTTQKGALASLELDFTPGDEISYKAYSYVCDPAEVVEATAESKTISFEFTGCLAIVTTIDVSAIGFSNAVSGGTITMFGETAVDACGVKWGTSDNTDEWNEVDITSDTVANNAFLSSIENLAANTNYFVQAYIQVAGKTILGDIKSFATLESPINVNIASVDSVSYSFATVTGAFAISDTSNIDSIGFVYSAVNNPTLESNIGIVLCDTVNGAINATIENLELDSTYFIRAFIIDSNLRVYSNSTEIKTLAPKAPGLKTSATDSVFQTTMKCYAEVTDDGGLSTSRGFLLSLDSVITLKNNTKKIQAGTGVGDFSMKIEGLTPDTVYMVRAFAFNSMDTIYGAIDTVRTLAYSVPMVQLLDTAEVYQKSLTAYGNVLSNGGKEITRYGFVISRDGSVPTYETNYKRVYQSGDYTGNYYDEFSSLTPETKYYIRAFAKNEIGVGYSELDSITTLPVSAPVIAIDSIAGITALSATCYVNLLTDGGSTVTKKGVVYSTSQIPDVSVNEGMVTVNSIYSKFEVELSGLNSSTKYYVRSFAINSIDTSYSTLDSITTLQSTVAQIELELSSFASDSAILNYKVINNGGAKITAKGIVWSTTLNPTIETNDGSAVDTNNNAEFDIVMNSLTASTVYYVRAYATNSEGTVYTDSIMFNSGYAIGISHEGGKVGYVFQPGDAGYVAGECHGIIVAKSDYMNKAVWGDNFLVLGAQQSEIGKGWENTQAIVDAFGNSGQNAAYMCTQISSGGYTDWFLPTVNEMKMFDKNKDAIGGFKDTDYANNMYWTSTDVRAKEANTYNFEHGMSMTTAKEVSFWFRPARYF